MVKYCAAYWEDVENVLGCVPNLDKLKGSSVFITGGTGMICSSVIELLFFFNQHYNAGMKILIGGRNSEKVCKRFSDFQNGEDYDFILYDATINEKVNIQADYIIHGASNANPGVLTQEPVETVLANVVGLNNLLAAAFEKGVKKVLYISSSEIYGNKKENRPYKENDYGYVDILNPRASYPSSKRAAETLCISYQQEYGVDTVIARPGHIYGPSITDKDDRASAQFTRNAIHGEDIVMKSAGQQLRSYCYTLDCASAILTILLNGESGNAYNISNKQSIVTINDVAQAIAKAAGRKVVYTCPSDQEVQGYNSMTNSSLDATKLEKLGWHACFGLEDGIDRTLKFYK